MYGDNTTVEVQALLKAFLNMSLRSACFMDECFFSGKKQNLRSCDDSAQASDYVVIDERNFAGLHEVGILHVTCTCTCVLHGELYFIY